MSKQADISSIIRWVWRHSTHIKWRVLLVCIIGVLRVGFMLSFVWVSKLLVDTATSSADTHRLVVLSVTLAALMLTEMTIMLVANYLTNTTEAHMRNSMRYQIYSHLLESQWGQSVRLHSGDLLNRITEDVRVVVDVVCKKLPDVVTMLFQLIGAFGLLLYMSPVLALCVVFILPLFLILSKIYFKRTRVLTSQIRDFDSKVHTSIQEGLQHHVVVQTLECEGQMHERLDSLQSRLYERTISRTRFSTFSRGMVRTGFIAGYLTAFIWSVWHLHTGAITFGTMTAFLQLVARIQNPIANLVRSVPAFVQAVTSVDRLIELDGIPADKHTAPISLSRPVGISISDITFSYPGHKQKIFSGFSYDFAPGSKTVVMGETGIGKSTLIRLILALIYPQQGSIEMYNDKQRVKVSPDTRCNIVYVPQGNSLLEGTIRENLLLGRPDATEEQLHDVLHTAAAEFVYALPDGLDTRCGELGACLSEGQAQRIAIARALLRDGNILLLDEFNSALDRTTAATMLRRLTEARAHNTIIFISHRPEVTEYCDNVLNLNHK